MKWQSRGVNLVSGIKVHSTTELFSVKNKIDTKEAGFWKQAVCYDDSHLLNHSNRRDVISKQFFELFWVPEKPVFHATEINLSSYFYIRLYLIVGPFLIYLYNEVM